MLEPHKNIFITGTDTNIGKTIVACSILFKINQQKRQAIGVKPISTGAKIINQQYQQQDTLALQEYSKIPIEHNQSNPWCFEPAISPHIAANYCKKEIKIADVRDHLYVLQQKYQEYFLLAEGAGGICCPINNKNTMLDLMQILNWPVIVVIGLKLGCLNHSILTINRLQQSGIKIAGWITTETNPMQAKNENLQSLKQYIQAPHLGDIPYLNQLSIKECAKHIKI